MDRQVSIMGIPLKNHLGYIKYVLSQRNEDSSTSFKKLIPGKDKTPIDLWYHGTNNLFRAAAHIVDTNLEFSSINQELPCLEDNVQIAIYLYEEAVSKFSESLEKLNIMDLDKRFPSPISGNDTRLDSWIGTNIMHSLGHIAQALRLHGMICENPNIFDNKH